MKNLLLKIAALIIAVTLSLTIFGCDDNGGDDTVQVTGDYKYKVATGTYDEDDGEGNITQKSYKYYIITGYQVSSEDALKMASGDFSTVQDFRSIEIPKTGKDLGEDNDYPVEEIAAGAFTNQIILTDVVIGENIKTIGEGAFAGCTNLKKISLPFIGESLEATGSQRVFGHIFGSSATTDGNLEVSAKIVERKNADGTSILTDSSVTFKVPTSLEEVDLSSSKITSISECAFYGMSMIKKVTLPDSVTEIDSHAFYSSGLSEVNLNKVTIIYESAFANCTSLKEVNFSSVEVIKQAVFQGCTNLGAKKFVDENSANAEQLLTVKLPQSVKELGKGAFKGCSSMKYVDIKGTQITVLENSLFADCLALIKATINDGSVLRAGAFVNCTKLAIDTDENGKTDAYNISGEYEVEEGAFSKLEE